MIRSALVALLLAPALVLPAAGAAAEADAPLLVAVREVPPFATRGEGGEWTGLSVELWKRVAEARGWSFEWRELPLAATIDALEAGEIDLGVAALSITERRESRIDFSHAYLTSGLGAAWRAEGEASWLDVLRGFAWGAFFRALAALALVLLIAGGAVWVFERRRNPEQFGGQGPLGGLAAAFWWSAVTMTTVGYGDMAPRTLGGRLVALAWMFTSVIIIASFTGALAASVTVQSIDRDQLRRRPLSELRVGVLARSSGEAFAEEQGARPLSFESLAAAVDALAASAVDVVVHDQAVLAYEARRPRAARIELSPGVLARDDYGFGLPPGSPRREELNLALLASVHDQEWERLRRRWLGD